MNKNRIAELWKLNRRLAFRQDRDDFAFRVSDIDGLVARLKAAGATLLSEVQQVPAVQVDYADVRKRLVYCLDPEGNLLELCAFE